MPNLQRDAEPAPASYIHRRDSMLSSAFDGAYAQSATLDGRAPFPLNSTPDPQKRATGLDARCSPVQQREVGVPVPAFDGSYAQPSPLEWGGAFPSDSTPADQQPATEERTARLDTWCSRAQKRDGVSLPSFDGTYSQSPPLKGGALFSFDRMTIIQPDAAEQPDAGPGAWYSHDEQRDGRLAPAFHDPYVRNLPLEGGAAFPSDSTPAAQQYVAEDRSAEERRGELQPAFDSSYEQNAPFDAGAAFSLCHMPDLQRAAEAAPAFYIHRRDRMLVSTSDGSYEQNATLDPSAPFSFNRISDLQRGVTQPGVASYSSAPPTITAAATRSRSRSPLTATSSSTTSAPSSDGMIGGIETAPAQLTIAPPIVKSEFVEGDSWKAGGAHLGRGAQGIVKLAVRLADKAVFAVKIFTRNAMEFPFAGKNWEARTLSKCAHPNIIGFVDAFAEGFRLLLVMEYAPGGSLVGLLDSKRVDEDCARRLASNLAAALQYLHARRIVHHDVKPANVLVAARKPLLVKLADLGCGEVIEQEVTYKKPVGTHLFIAPEIIARRPHGPPCDLWSLGMTVFCCLISQSAPLPRDYNDEKPALGAIDWVMLRGNTKHARSWLLAVTEWHPVRRATASKALKHVWLNFEDFETVSKFS
ncbi:kinase-like protein [Auricularia subglabra TFB-10046 SS5]|nr:kinase-like protein [Auricularia subglabra TFB-10046 SS5]